MWEWLTTASNWEWFAAPFEGQNWWQILNAGFIGTMISAFVGILVARRVGEVAREPEVERRLKQKAERQESRARDALPDSDEEPASDSAGSGDPTTPAPAAPTRMDDAARQAFTTASNAIRHLKDYIDALADRCRDGRTRRKYDNITRRDYRIITTAIGEDGGLKSPHLEKLLAAFEEWRTYRNGRVTVPKDVASRLQALAGTYRVTTTTPARWKPDRAEVQF